MIDFLKKYMWYVIILEIILLIFFLYGKFKEKIKEFIGRRIEKKWLNHTEKE